MTRISNTKQEIRALFSKTGNQCAFPECVHPLIDCDDDFVAQICHIEAAEERGPRYNPSMTDADRKSIKNLIVLCYGHHKKIDRNPNVYTVSCLQKMKLNHEKKYSGQPHITSDKAIERIVEEQLSFENEISLINEEWQRNNDLAMHLRISENPSEHLNNVFNSVSYMEDILHHVREFFDKLPETVERFFGGLGYDLADYQKVPYYKNPFCNAFWEDLNLGLQNWLMSMDFHLKSLEYHMEIQKLKAHHNDVVDRTKPDELKSQIRKLSSTSMHAD